MSLHPVLQEKLTAGLDLVSAEGWPRRDARLPAIRNKVHTALGMRRVGKTTFLRQLQRAEQKALARERAYQSLQGGDYPPGHRRPAVATLVGCGVISDAQALFAFLQERRQGGKS